MSCARTIRQYGSVRTLVCHTPTFLAFLFVHTFDFFAVFVRLSCVCVSNQQIESIDGISGARCHENSLEKLKCFEVRGIFRREIAGFFTIWWQTHIRRKLCSLLFTFVAQWIIDINIYNRIVDRVPSAERKQQLFLFFGFGKYEMRAMSQPICHAVCWIFHIQMNWARLRRRTLPLLIWRVDFTLVYSSGARWMFKNQNYLFRHRFFHSFNTNAHTHTLVRVRRRREPTHRQTQTRKRCRLVSCVCLCGG